jgi:hypothetical protein
LYQVQSGGAQLIASPPDPLGAGQPVHADKCSVAFSRQQPSLQARAKLTRSV